MNRSDEELVAAHRQGDTTAFSELVRRHADSLLGYLVRMTDDRGQAEDLFQETFQKVHQRASSFQNRGSFKSWLFSIATNKAVDQLRRNAGIPKMVSISGTTNWSPQDNETHHRESIRPETDCSNPSYAATLAEEQIQVRQALESFSARQLATVTLAYYEGLTYKQVADVLGCSVGTVKAQMFRALRRLAVLLSNVGGAEK